MITSIPFLFEMIVFITVALYLPGPNNIMLAASGVNFGFKRTIPHILGVFFGFLLLVLLVGLGLRQIFESFPPVRDVLRVLAFFFVVYLAWGIARSGEVKETGSGKSSRPQYFWEAGSFQLINPKGLAMAISTTSTFISPNYDFIPQFIAIFLCFMVVTSASATSWVVFGMLMRRLINTASKRLIFNNIMALLLLLTMLPIALDVMKSF